MSEGIQSQNNYSPLKSDKNWPNSNIKVNKSEMLGINDSKMNKTAAQIIKSKNSINLNMFTHMDKEQLENNNKKQQQSLEMSKKISKDSINNNNNYINIKNNNKNNISNNNENNNINNDATFTNISNPGNSINNNDISNNNNINNQKDSNENITFAIENNLQIDINYLKDDPTIEKTRLSDLENKSYLNSVLQCLANIDELCKYFMDKSVIENIYNLSQEKLLSFTIQRLFFHSKHKKDKKYSADSIAIVLAKKNIIFEQNKAEVNPKNCLYFMLEQLHNELNINKIKNNNLMNYNQYNEQEVINCGKYNYEQLNKSIISDTFSWYGLKEYHCYQYSHKKFLFQTFYTFELDIFQYYNLVQYNKIRIYDCLDYSCLYLKTSNEYCDVCKKYCTTKNSLKIINSPNIMIFIIDRGNFENYYLNLNFILENEINLSPYMYNQKKDVKYELNSILSVLGNKFISLIKADEDYWYLFNDSNVRKVENSDIFNNNSSTGLKHIPFILFYKLKK